MPLLSEAFVGNERIGVPLVANGGHGASREVNLNATILPKVAIVVSGRMGEPGNSFASRPAF